MSENGPGSPSDVDPGAENPETPEPEVYNCTEPGCDKNFPSLAALRGHSRVHRKAEPTITPAASPTPSADPEAQYWKDEASRLSLEVKALRLNREREKLSPPDNRRGDHSMTVDQIAAAEYFDAKRQLLLEQHQNGDSPAITEDPRVEELTKKVEQLGEQLRKKELDELKGQITQLREAIDRKPPTDNVQIELLRTIDKRIDGIGRKADPIFEAVGLYLRPSQANLPAAPAANPNELPPSAMELVFKQKGLIQ